MGRPATRLRDLIDERDDGCWNWSGNLNALGQGTITREGRTWLAHRYVYQTMRAVPIEGTELRRSCRNLRCVNPDHLVAAPNPRAR
jgi:hypothetical protein